MAIPMVKTEFGKAYLNDVKTHGVAMAKEGLKPSFLEACKAEADRTLKIIESLLEVPDTKANREAGFVMGPGTKMQQVYHEMSDKLSVLQGAASLC